MEYSTLNSIEDLENLRGVREVEIKNGFHLVRVNWYALWFDNKNLYLPFICEEVPIKIEKVIQ